MSKPDQSQTTKYEVHETQDRENKFWIINPAGDAELGNWLIARTWYEPYAHMIVTALNAMQECGINGQTPILDEP